MQGGIAEGAINQFQNGNGLRNTAYIAWAIAESGGADDARLGRTLQYMAGKIGTETDAYTLALCANAMASAGRKTEAATILDRLEKTKVTEDKLVHWKSTGEGATYSRGESLEIETTALVAYAMLRADRYVPTAKKALAWLISRKDPRGTWYSTQETVHAMRALLAGTKPGADDNTNLQVTIAVNGQRVEDLAITPETADVFRLFSLRGQVRSGTNQIALETSGTGSLDYQIVARHYSAFIKAKQSKVSARRKISRAAGDGETYTIIDHLQGDFLRTERDGQGSLRSLGVPSATLFKASWAMR